MNFNFNNRSGGQTRNLSSFVVRLGLAMQNLYDENDDEEYRQALKDTYYEMCKLLKPMGIPLKRTPIARWQYEKGIQTRWGESNDYE